MEKDSPTPPEAGWDSNPGEEIDLLKEEIKRLRQQNELLRNRPEPDASESSDPIVPDRGAQALQLAEMIIENSPAILFRRLASEDLAKRRMVYVSPNISRFGYRAEDFLENRIMFREIVYPGDTDRIVKEIEEFVEQGIETYSQTYRIVTGDGALRWVEDRTSVVEDEITGLRYHQGIVIDVHKRKEAEEKLRKSEEKHRRIVETAGEGFLLMDKDLHILELNSAFARMVGRERSELYGKNPFEQGTGEYRKYLASCKAEGAGLDYREFECELRYKDKRIVPVLVHANTLRSDNGEIIGNMAFVTDMTQQKKALSLAGEVQRSLLPDKPPEINGFDIAGKNIPCDEVGGDYFDFLWDDLSDGVRFSVVVGDIVGHGVDSALLMSSARAFLRMRASQAGTLTDIVTDMNQHLTEDLAESGRFMTLFYLDFDRNAKRLEWIRAGHDPALVYDPETDIFEELKGPGLALGVVQDYEYVLQSKNGLKAGQVVVIATDGIWEGCNPAGEMFGKQRLRDIVRRASSHPAETILERVFQAQEDFSDGVKTADDITLVVVKVMD
jgi:sigma-B regulation protein RsbU (phosphoserine phosphatase)